MTGRSRAQGHARRSHTCSSCGKVCRGNGYAHHQVACALRMLTEAQRDELLARWKAAWTGGTDAAPEDRATRDRFVAAKLIQPRADYFAPGGPRRLDEYVFTELGYRAARALARRKA